MVARAPIHTDVFVVEFEEQLRVLALLPGAGAPYPQAGVPGLRCIYAPNVACLFYYTFDFDKSSFALSGAPTKDADLD